MSYLNSEIIRILKTLPSGSYIKIKENIEKSESQFGTNPEKKTYRDKICLFDSVDGSRVRIKRKEKDIETFRSDLSCWSFHVGDIDIGHLLETTTTVIETPQTTKFDIKNLYIV